MKSKTYAVNGHKIARVRNDEFKEIYCLAMPNGFRDETLIDWLGRCGFSTINASVVKHGRISVPFGYKLICANTGRLLLDNSIAA